MVFIRKSADPTPLVDAVFSVVAMARKDKLENGDENVVDATIGSLYADDGKLVALVSVIFFVPIVQVQIVGLGVVQGRGQGLLGVLFSGDGEGDHGILLSWDGDG